MSSRDAYFNVCKDPWDAPPAGIPDQFESHSVPFKLKASYLVSSQPDGTFAAAFHPTLNSTSTGFSALATSTTGNITAFGQAVHPDAPTVITQFSLFRPVSIGAKVFYLGAEATSAGVISTGHNDYMIANTAQIGTSFPTAIADWSDLPNSSSMAVSTMTEPIAVAARSFDRPAFGILSNTNTTASFPTIWVTGTNLVASTPVVRIEVSFNIEAIPYHGNTLTAHLQSVTQPDEAAMAAAHRRLGVVRTGPLSKLMKVAAAKRKATGPKRKRKRKYKKSGASMKTTQLMQPPRGNRRPTPVRKRPFSAISGQGVRY